MLVRDRVGVRVRMRVRIGVGVGVRVRVCGGLGALRGQRRGESNHLKDVRLGGAHHLLQHAAAQAHAVRVHHAVAHAQAAVRSGASGSELGDHVACIESEAQPVTAAGKVDVQDRWHRRCMLSWQRWRRRRWVG